MENAVWPLLFSNYEIIFKVCNAYFSLVFHSDLSDVLCLIKGDKVM
jgi:hypothetical protein